VYHTEAEGGAHTESGHHPVNWGVGHFDVEDIATVGTDIYVGPKPNVVVLPLDSAEAVLPEVRQFSHVVQRTCGQRHDHVTALALPPIPSKHPDSYHNQFT